MRDVELVPRKNTFLQLGDILILSGDFRCRPLDLVFYQLRELRVQILAFLRRTALNIDFPSLYFILHR